MTGKIPSISDIDGLHRVLAPSQEAYDLIHTHCEIVATITRLLVHRQNGLFARRCTLPKDQVHTVPPTDGVSGGTIPPYYIDVNTAVLGALLHDIGAYKVLQHDGTDGEPLEFDKENYIKHGLIGYEILLNEGYDESIAEFARNHTGVGLTAEMVEQQHLPIPVDDYVPMNLAQEIVMVADKYHSKSVPPKFLTAQAYAKRAAKYGKQNEELWLELVQKYGTPDVETLAKEYNMPVKR